MIMSHNDGGPTDRQHSKPCIDCPWRREALRGWLGGLQPAEWVELAHGEGQSECHVHHTQQCAGMAIYRANVAKTPRDRTALRLPADRAKVFATPVEFLNHHNKRS